MKVLRIFLAVAAIVATIAISAFIAPREVSAAPNPLAKPPVVLANTVWLAGDACNGGGNRWCATYVCHNSTYPNNHSGTIYKGRVGGSSYAYLSFNYAGWGNCYYAMSYIQSYEWVTQVVVNCTTDCPDVWLSQYY